MDDTRRKQSVRTKKVFGHDLEKEKGSGAQEKFWFKGTRYGLHIGIVRI